MRGRIGTTRMPGGRFIAVPAAGCLLVAAMAGAPARAATTATVTCTYIIQNTWYGGFSADIKITNTGPVAINGWTVRWTFNEYTTDISTWQSNLSAPDGLHATATNASYNGTIPSGYATSFGWTGRSTSVSVPTDLSVNGVAC
ncbi:MAG TPA: cellulose binding domain-containing protein [Actinocrinis sp.]|nr:cellulose binding domain-containing protein [Actinocrinis sp.]